MSRRSSTPTFDFSPDEMRRFCHPDEYPCYNADNVYKPMSGCRERCCIVPCVTPEGDDSPKWVATLAARKEGAAPMARQERASPTAQPIFDEPQVVTPSRTTSRRRRAPRRWARTPHGTPSITASTSAC